MSSTALATRPKEAAHDGPELTLVGPPTSQIHSLIPRSVEEALVYARAFAGSGMFAVRSTEGALTILLTGMELGMAPAQSMRAFHVIEGKPSPSADTLQALCLARPDVCRYFTLISLSDQEATFETHRVGAPGPVRADYTVENAQAAGLLGKKNWTVNRPQMLAARAKAKLARLIYPDLTLGLYTPEELTSGEVLDAELQEAVDRERREAEEYAAACGDLRRDVRAMAEAARQGDPAAFARMQAAWNGYIAEAGARGLSDLGREQLGELYGRLVAALNDAPAPPDAEEAVIVGPPAAPPVNEFPSARAARQDGTPEELEMSGEDDPFADD